MMRGSALLDVKTMEDKTKRLLQQSDKSIDPRSREIIEFAYKHVESFEEIAKRTLWSNLDKEISSAVFEINNIVQCQIKKEIQFSTDDLEKKFHSLTLRVKDMEEYCVDGLYNSFQEEEEEEDDRDGVSSGISYGGDSKSKIVGVADVYEKLKEKLMRFEVTSLVGMPGIGKTTLVKKLLEDPEVVKSFDYCVWIRAGKKCQLKDIPRRILGEIDPDRAQMLREGDEDGVNEYLKANLKSKRYLVVLDDVWDRYMAYFLIHTDNIFDIKHPFFHPESGSRILLTSRLQQVDQRHREFPVGDISMRLLNKEESWDLLREKVFSRGSCPPHLLKAGKKISENCEGLPLTIVTVAALLSKKEASPEYWNEVAARKNHLLFKDAYDEISKVLLLPSYTYLPPLLQKCFLFVGLFPQDYEIPRSKLINIWVADGFRELKVNISSHYGALGCLEELVSNNLVMVRKQSTLNSSYTVKTCGLHSSEWYLSNKKARETNFALVLSNPNDDIGDGQHARLSIHSNTLFAIKGLYKSVEDKCASSARSLLCYGPYHQYQVPICFGLKLLRELDALSIRFYEFPMEVLQLVELRYLTLTLNGMIPASISKLSKLQFLIVDRHLSIKSRKEDPSYLPVEIWGMKELKHLQVTGSDLPDPCGACLGSLSTLSNVSARSCTKAVLRATPNLRELRIRIELAHYDDGKPFSCFPHISHLGGLSSLKCLIVNPEVVPPVVPFSRFPTYLAKLSLSGLGYPWKEINRIASLQHLYVLKLKNYAFQGPEWEVEETGFSLLGSLVIEDTDLVDWKVGYGAFNILKFLRLKHCYKLEKIHGVFMWSLEKIELVDCNPSCAEQMKQSTPNRECGLDVHSSWD